MLSRIQISKRFLHLHEYQSLGVFSKFGVGVPRFEYATSPADAEASASRIGGEKVVVKAQVLAGGRGMGHFKENKYQGGVKVASSPGDAKNIASNMIGNTLITKQTGEAGKPCNGVLVSEFFRFRPKNTLPFSWTVPLEDLCL